MQQLTLVYLLKDQQICLGYKKRGFGAGNWNGYGGKVQSGESLEACAVRELKEESRVIASESDLRQVAVLEFLFPDQTHLEVHAYFLDAFVGTPAETEEMRPQWFSVTEIPYDKMWADDMYWLPRALLGETLLGKVWFDDKQQLLKMEWQRTVF